MSYTFSILQLHTFTNETLNVGIVLKDAQNNIYTFFSKIKNLSSCIAVKDADAINFLVQSIEDDIKHECLNIEEYNSFSLTQRLVYTTSSAPHKALDELVDTYISIKPFLSKVQRNFNIYDKREIHKSFRKYAKDNNVNNLKAGVHFKKIAYKAIDLALIDSSNNPYSIATMTSPHVDNFKDSFVTNIFTLQEAVKKGSAINTKFLYAPVFDNIIGSNNKKIRNNIDWAKEQAQEYGFDIFTDSRESAAIEMLLN